LLLLLLKEGDDDSQYTSLQIIQDLMQKCPDGFLDYFAQLGIFNKVMNLCGPMSDDEQEKTTTLCKPTATTDQVNLNLNNSDEVRFNT